MFLRITRFELKKLLKSGGLLSINRIAQQLSEIESTPTLGNKA